MSTTTVRITTNRKKLFSCPIYSLFPSEAEEFLRLAGGQRVVVLLPPVKEPPYATNPPYPPPCKTFHWQMANEEKLRLRMTNEQEVYLCEHALDVD